MTPARIPACASTRESEDLPFLWKPSGMSVVGWSFSVAGAASDFHGSTGREDLQTPLLFEGVFDGAECARIVERGRAAVPWHGRYSGDDPDYRRCLTSWIEEAPDDSWVFDRLRAVARSANARYGFALRGFGEPAHFIRYDVGGRFDWHTDLGAGPASTRKISISVQLSEPGAYDGGTLELCPHGPIYAFRARGAALVFPAYVPHRVLPIARGTRHALVAWLHGDAFA